jgi:hypothetical protein
MPPTVVLTRRLKQLLRLVEKKKKQLDRQLESEQRKHEKELEKEEKVRVFVVNNRSLFFSHSLTSLSLSFK